MHDRLRIAFSVTGGLGDYIVSAKVLEEIQEYVPDAQIDVFTDKVAFGNAIYGSRENVKVNDGFLYQKNSSTYDLALDVGHFIRIDSFFESSVGQFSIELAGKIKYIVDNWESLYIDIPEQWWRERIRFESCKQLGLDRWTEQRMGEAFRIENKKVFIPLNAVFGEEWAHRGYTKGKYITINYGADKMAPGKRQQLKLWRKANYEKLICLVKGVNPGISFIQLGATDAEKVGGCDEYVLGESIELTKWAIKGALCHIDCEGGLVHLATQLDTKCIVIFGPTPVHMYGYESNINLVSRRCSNCMGLHKSWAYDCYCGNGGNCMDDISPENVFDEVKRIISANED